MKGAAGNNIKNILNVALLLVLLLLNSCSSNKDAPPFNLIEYSETEHTIVNNVYLYGENLKGINEADLLAKIRNYAIGIDTLALDASLDSTTWQVKECVVGRRVNVEKTLELILSAQEGHTAELITEEVQPTVTAQNISDKLAVIGDYTTPLLDRSSSRVNNIKVAAKKLDYFILPPGKEFSFNNTLGRRTEAMGYKPATIIISTKDGPGKSLGVGGGICQVSSTLYNAVSKSGLQILERHGHTLNVGYVPKGKDATVSYGNADFRFKNTSKHSIMFRTYLSNNTLTIKVIENRNP